MPRVPESDVLLALLALAAVVFTGRLAGHLAHGLGQPEVLGQLVAGILIGPSLFGTLLPGPYQLVTGNSVVTGTLSVLSWTGVILLLTLAGAAVDTRALRRLVKPGILTATGAIVPSLVAGAAFGRLVLGASGFYLGIVLAVTATSELTSILLEPGLLDRFYGQVILEAGVISEVAVWPLVAVASSLSPRPAWFSLVVSVLALVGFFLVIFTLGRRLLDWGMRKVADLAPLPYGRLSLVLTLAFITAAATQALGLHVLLGAFAFGLILQGAPRFDPALRGQIAAITTALFGPIFFVTAGSLIDLSQLHSLTALAVIGLLVLVASAVKVVFAGAGALLGGLPVSQSLLVGVGLNLRGGTGLTVAIIGVELHLLSSAAFAAYAVASVVIVVASPSLIGWLAQRSPPTPAERVRLDRLAVERHAYGARLERVLLPQVATLRPVVTAEIAAAAARARYRVGEPVDLVEVISRPPEESAAVRREVTEILARAATCPGVAVLRAEVGPDVVTGIRSIARPGDLVSIGAGPPPADRAFTLGRLPDALLRSGVVDVVVTVSRTADFDCAQLRRVLVPVNGLEESLAVADLAGLIAAGCGAAVTVMAVVQPVDDLPRAPEEMRLRLAGRSIARDAALRLSRFNTPLTEVVRIGTHPADEILRELATGAYQLVALAGTERGRGEQLYLGGAIEEVVVRAPVPTLLMVARRVGLTTSDDATPK